MSDLDVLKPITCPACQGERFERNHEGHLICSQCGARYISSSETTLCPACGFANATQCANCSTALEKRCQACGKTNPPGSLVCFNCASPLDTLAAVSMRIGEGKQQSLELRENVLLNSKGADAQFMQQQRARMDQLERERLAQIQQNAQQNQREQKTLIIIVLGSLAVLIIITLVLASIVALNKF
jgi:hypothetical protein